MISFLWKGNIDLYFLELLFYFISNLVDQFPKVLILNPQYLHILQSITSHYSLIFNNQIQSTDIPLIQMILYILQVITLEQLFTLIETMSNITQSITTFSIQLLFILYFIKYIHMLTTQELIKIQNYVYHPKYCLGEGAFAKVYEGFHQTNKKKVAIKKLDQKFINSDQYLKHSLKGQIQILKKFNHPNIVKMLDCKFTANSIYIITQFCSGGDLKSLLSQKKLSQQQSLKIFKQICAGMKQLVKQKIIHRDIKPANILIHQGVFKIADFGFAKYSNNRNNCKTMVGTPMYMSPQQLRQQQYTMKSDIWSFGVMFYQMLFKCLPWQGKNEGDLLKQIMSKPLVFPRESRVSNRSIDICSRMLSKQQGQRASWQKIFELSEYLKINNTNSNFSSRTTSSVNSLFSFLSNKVEQKPISSQQQKSNNMSKIGCNINNIDKVFKQKNVMYCQENNNNNNRGVKRQQRRLQVQKIIEYSDDQDYQIESKKNIKPISKRPKNMLANTTDIQLKPQPQNPPSKTIKELLKFCQFSLNTYYQMFKKLIQSILSLIRINNTLTLKQSALNNEIREKVFQLCEEYNLQIVNVQQCKKQVYKMQLQKVNKEIQELGKQQICLIQQYFQQFNLRKMWQIQREGKQVCVSLMNKIRSIGN